MASGTQRILVVEDDVAIREAIAEILAEEGYTVSCAANGLEALDRLREDVPSLILLDLSMPLMDGWAFRERQRVDPALSRIPTIVVTASHPSDVASIDELRADAFLAKPFDLDRLMAEVHRLAA